MFSYRIQPKGAPPPPSNPPLGTIDPRCVCVCVCVSVCVCVRAVCVYCEAGEKRTPRNECKDAALVFCSAANGPPGGGGVAGWFHTETSPNSITAVK